MKPPVVQPILASQRITIIDILRGWALFGVVLMNYYDAYFLGDNLKISHPGTFTVVLEYISAYVFSAKSWTMLSFLFGYGFAVLMERLHAKGRHPVWFFTRRMWWLLVLALINSAFFSGDILKDYAILGMVLLPFYKCSARTTFIIAIAMLLTEPVLTSFVVKIPSPHWDREHWPLLYGSHDLMDVLKAGLIGTYYTEMISPFYGITVHWVMMTCFLFGFSAQKIGFFSHLAQHKKVLWRVWWITLTFALIIIVPKYINARLAWPFKEHYPISFIVVLAIMFFIMSSLCLLYLGGSGHRFFSTLEVTGKMTLTNYMVQNVIGCLVFSGFGLGLIGREPLYFYLGLAVVVYLLQALFSRWWLSRYNYGPVEWVWRQLSYGTRLALKRPALQAV
ncbi:DUF418 domain-containing protein [Dinghuibacter silviterrae]|uniref:DUF418 domain-containing protein n=1 Tax=Dinghuibacter silviterrae TaxID=1539049 RepID=A0A4R8DPT8_9BACT|nr:DUF418 domain-containing protein [Dinghuibacter silviterrae]TDW99747.1 uncharacterized protein EDB95_0758 [Dinghuibacter silviterrae]